MKANEAPEKIYIDVSLDSAWGMTERSYDNEVEYTRTDAFIEKACEWLKNNVEKYYYLDEAYDKVISIKNLNNDFKSYMEGEKGMAKYRIEHRYPCYANGGCIPYDGYFVQKLEEGFFTGKWVDVKGFGDRERAEELLKILKS